MVMETLTFSSASKVGCYDRPLDSIVVRAIKAYGYTGLLPEEQKLGQWFSVDILLGLDTRSAGRSDSLEFSIDYVDVVQIVKNCIQELRLRTIEALAEDICRQLFGKYKSESHLRSIKLGLTKCTPPISNFDGSVAIIIERYRGDYSDQEMLTVA